MRRRRNNGFFIVLMVGTAIMKPSIRLAIVFSITMVASGCKITPVQYAGSADIARQCSNIMTRVMVDPSEPGGVSENPGAEAFVAADPLVSRIDRLFDAPGEPSNETLLVTDDEPVGDSVLFLSGGSQNGAFGAGFLAQWAEERGARGLPRFRLVTGISTGALQSTFAFLDDPEEIERRYSIGKEGELLEVFTPGGGLRSKSKLEQLRGVASLARRGALSDLQPLRQQLHELISPDVLRRVAEEAGPDLDRPRRMLLVGAVEMDSGDAFVFDLTKAAQLYARDVPEMRDCYIEALMASSSVPMAALPVFIDGKMYIDGGARFGIISDFTASIYQRQAARLRTLTGPGASDRFNLFILVNGTLEVGRTCHLADCDESPLPDVLAGETPRHSDWSFDKLAMRSLSVLINQSYRSSVFWATRRSGDLGFDAHFVRIEDPSGHRAMLYFDAPQGEELSCAKWKERDELRDRPLEFHPRFMRCLISYGRARATEERWAQVE